jgi:hypothetical protein
MHLMNQPAFSRLVLLGPAHAARNAKVRRYRLARLKLEGNDARPRGESRYAHLKRVYD